jgi:hypothetical protein
MLRRLSALLPLAALIAAIVFTFGSAPSSSNSVTVPIQVLGPDGHTESITVNASDVSNVDRIWFYTYSQGDPLTRDLTPKAQISINGSSWIDVANDNNAISCMSPEDVFGCVEGVYWTTRWVLDLDQAGVSLNDGSNTITFRHNLEVGSLGSSGANISSGYYVLGLSFLNGGDPLPHARKFTSSGASGADPNDWMNAGAIDGTAFTWWNPMQDAGFGIPDGMNNSSDIDAGKTLWNKRNHLVDYPGGPDITASCADCHTAKGDDIQAFAFSNKSIVARAKFHDLSETEGQQIAAYIRSLHSRDEIVAKGPWQPPYQPGPELSSFNPDCEGLHPDEAPEKCWAAGAGMEWVLDRDAQSKQHLFPNGLSGQAGLDVASTLNTMNVRDIPTALQFPDWNEWLPRTHPLDATSWSQSDFQNHDINTKYASGNVEEEWEVAESEPDSKGSRAIDAMSRWGTEGTQFQKDYIDKGNGPINEHMGLRQWKAVKTWEVMRGREGYAPQFYSTTLEDVTGNPIKTIEGEVRSWVGTDRTIFNVSPHIHKAKAYGSDGSIEDLYMDTVWYELQLILNAGNRHGINIRPMDWKYHLQHVGAVEKAADEAGYGYAEPYRYLKGYIKQNQQIDTGDAPETENQGLEDWHWRHASHRWLVARRSASSVKRPVDDLPAAERSAITTTVLRAYMDRIERVPVSSDGYDCGTVGGTCQWERASDDINDLEPADWVPSTDGFMGDSEAAEAFYEATGWIYEEFNTDPHVIGRMYDWAAAMWPKGNDTEAIDGNPTWDELNPCREPNKTASCTAPSGPSVTLTEPADGASFDAPATITLSANASAPDDTSVDRVIFNSGSTTLTEDTGAPFEYTWSDVEIGEYTLTAEVVTESGESSTSAPVDVSVTDPAAPDNGVHYQYYEGSWTQLPNFSSLTPTTTGTSSSFDLTAREQDDDFALRFVTYVEITAADNYTFYLNSDDGSKLLVDGNTVVTNDGIHAMEEKSGTISLSEGWHKLVVEYFEASGGEGLEVDWASSSFSKTAIPESQLFLSPSGSQNIPLTTGWNFISSFVSPTDALLDQVFSDANDLVIVKNEDGDVYNPSENENQIGKWKSSEGYLVYVGSDQTLTMSGSGVSATTSIELSDGWNVVPYYPRSSMTVASAFDSIRNDLVMVKDEQGNSYIPSMGINEIGDVVPGEGYEVYVTSPVTLTYPTP